MKLKLFILLIVIGSIVLFKYLGKDGTNLNENTAEVNIITPVDNRALDNTEIMSNNKVSGKKLDILDQLDKLDSIRQFSHTFTTPLMLEETGKMSESTDENFWVNSGAYLITENGRGRTLFGELPKDSKWQIRYHNAREATAKETDDGYHPQNIFRLVTRSKWKNLRQEVFYNIRKYNLSNSFYRKASNAILLFNRYQDGFNLYYVGLRVDGNVIVKKKYKGKYYTMASEKLLDGIYDIKTNPNLIPTNQWIGVRSEVRNINSNQVEIKAYININRDKEDWREIIRVIDDGKSFGGEAILAEGYAGIRTDFMDVEFDDYKIEEVD